MRDISPIILDEENVILAGHTRYKALKHLNRINAPCIVVNGLTEHQKRKYRLLDNKLGEIADWDIDLLGVELQGLDFGELDLNWITDQDSIQINAAEPVDLDEEAHQSPPGASLIHCPKCGFVFEGKV